MAPGTDGATLRSQLLVQMPPPAAHPPAASTSYARSSGAYTQREEHLQQQEAAGELQFAYVLNDGTPQNMIWLIGLKNVFSRQLPNMPKEYIARLVLNRHHRSVALVNRNGAVIGGITYRIFPGQTFGEIAFCAVTAAEQVKGFGTRLMNRTKQAARDNDGLTHFLTYADNNAVGYFLKQGFTRAITLPREVWGGFIKDYDGGTLMECVLHPKLPYGDLAGMLRAQKEALDSAMRALSNGHVVHDPPARAARALPPDEAHQQQREVPVPLDVGAVAGVRTAGWTPHNAPKPRYRIQLDGTPDPVPVTPTSLCALMEGALAALDAHTDAWPFRRPVDPSEAIDYYDIIKDPVDLSLVRCRLRSGAFYRTLEIFVADLRRIFSNCRYYNTQATPYYQAAVRLEAALDSYLGAHLVYDE